MTPTDTTYRLVIDDVMARLMVAKPKTMQTVNHILSKLRSGDESWYGLMVGEIQSGKTPAQMILIWVFSRHYEFLGHVCFVTKCLDSIRRDVMGKFKSDLINQHIVAACSTHCSDMSPAKVLSTFGLSYHIYTDHTTALLGKPGLVELMLMQKDNYTHIREWFKLNGLKSAAPVLFLMDEVHELYTGTLDLLPDNGLTTIYGHTTSMLHWFKRQMTKSKTSGRRCYMIGVTATPYSPMTADPICWPTEIFRLETDAPATGLTYYGYKDYVLSGIQFQTYSAGLVDMEAIAAIMGRPRNCLNNGNKEITLICITLYSYNEMHREIADIIKGVYGDRVVPLVFNQTNKTSLEAWFKPSMLTKEVCEAGALIIIGKACMAAGITVKPIKPMMATWEGVTYQVTGITDQFMPATKINVTTTMQLMRILGWYPDGHQATLWLSSDELHGVYRYDMGSITRQFMELYDPKVGPISVKHINVTSKGYIRSFYENSPYRVRRSGTALRVDKYKPVQGQQGQMLMETDYLKLSEGSLKDMADMRLMDVTQAKMIVLRALCGFTRYIGGKNGDYLHIATDESSYKAVMTGAAFPKPKSSSNVNKVNGFLWGANGVETKLKDCYLVKFKESWLKRTQGAYQTPDNMWIYIVNHKEFTHNLIMEYESVDGYSDTHHTILRIMDGIKRTARPLRALANVVNL